ncbi:MULTISPECIES: hypothetical protein [unclassified Pseudomonas]|uniref:hypothetical protein n=1 Tax=unclassified Pseudomonas TaxID=196821 RepID=UPI000730C5E2|nr:MULTISPECIES: hypothetical protein [unclassified Pseudomonas]KSW28519.1 hypothetical protein AOX63_00365 [Pseudomonas sp. ADP]OBP12073.1 hypothetical protein BAE52_05920 [Pseudomonas sp. EGD-AKN5]QOF85667.1 hypothetical protein IG194_02895 [Pseudomonas sp. ADPe]
MLLVALVVLNAICLICGLLFNAELLNMAGADIPLKELQSLEIYSQILASASVCLFTWRMCIWGHRRWGGAHYIGLSIALSTAVAAPATWWIQGEAPDLIAEKFPASLRVYSLYAYVTKKGLLYDSLQIPGVPYQEHRDTGDGKAFIANLGVLMSVQGSYVQKIDQNFYGFATAVFKGFTRRNGDRLYERLQEEVVPQIEDIIRAYAKLEAFRATRIPGNEWKPIAWPKPGEYLDYIPTAEDYARAIKPGLRTRQAIVNTPEVRHFAKEALGPLYVNGMDVLATRKQFDQYLPGIASNMAFDVAHTDIHGEQGLNVLKNMWFVPWSLLSGLFMGALNLSGLVLSAVEPRGLIQGRRRLVRLGAVAVIIFVPLISGNSIIRSEGYRTAFRSIERGPTIMAGVFHWAMSAEAMLYDLTKPLLKAE